MSKSLPENLSDHQGSVVSSPMQGVSFRGQTIYVKRDDLFSLPLSLPLSPSSRGTSGKNDNLNALTGNKGRKLHYYFQRELPYVSRIISYGSAQSNMLYSLAALAKIKGWDLEFYVDHIPTSLRSNPRGNYAAALAFGADVRVATYNEEKIGGHEKTQGRLEQYVREQILPLDSDALYVPEGGAGKEAEEGLIVLAGEIHSWVAEAKIKNPKVMLASGTGTTAYYLQKHLPFEVLTCACVGSHEYLQQQFSRIANNNKFQPTVLPPAEDSEGRPLKFQFGKLYPALYDLWKEVQQETGITFDLLYDPIGWIQMLAYINSQRIDNGKEPDMIYLHQGGLLGNETMLERYARKYSSGT